MGTSVYNPDCLTSRPPFRPPEMVQETESVPYTFLADFQEDYPTDGSPRRCYSVVRVKATAADAFLRAVLPDVREDTRGTGDGQSLYMRPWAEVGRYFPEFGRNPIVRHYPEPHPYREKLWVTHATVIGGEGFPKRDVDGSLTFETRVFREAGAADFELEPMTRPGFVRIGVTWQDLPYDPAPFGVDTDGACNGENGSELYRYCIFKPVPKGRAESITGGVSIFIDDDGTVIKASSDANAPPLTTPDPQTYFVASTDFTITLKMVPRVPYAAEAMRMMVNQYNNFRFPSEVFPRIPDVGTLFYRGFELSDPYYTISGQKVFDIHYAITYIPGGNDDFRRGFNSRYCPRKREFRRTVFGLYDSGTGAITRAWDNFPLTAPVTDDGDPDQTQRLVFAGGNAANFADLENLFRFEGDRLPS